MTEGRVRSGRIAAIADEPRPFRAFLGEHLRRLGFDVTYFETGDPTFDYVRRTRAAHTNAQATAVRLRTSSIAGSDVPATTPPATM